MKATENIKGFVKKHKKGIIFIGGVIVGVTVAALIIRSKTVEVTKEVLPEWAEKWSLHCMDNNLLCENGLPIFANAEQTQIFRDAIGVEDVIPDLIDSGFEIVERV